MLKVITDFECITKFTECPASYKPDLVAIWNHQDSDKIDKEQQNQSTYIGSLPDYQLSSDTQHTAPTVNQ